MNTLTSWQCNTIPLPQAALIGLVKVAGDVAAQSAIAAQPQTQADQHVPVQAPQGAVVKPVVEEVKMPEINDLFSKGRITKYFPRQGYGIVTDKNGHEVYFSLAEMDFAGEKGKESLKTGIFVGFDPSWTSHGLHIKKMKIY